MAPARPSAAGGTALLCQLQLSGWKLDQGTARRVVAKVEWHPSEMYPRVGFVVSNLPRPAEGIVAFYNLANFLRTLATPEAIETWLLTSLHARLGGRLVKHVRYAVFQLAEAALPRKISAGVTSLIDGLRGPPAAMVAT